MHRHLRQEYARACLIAYEAQPKHGFQEGWGAPGQCYSVSVFLLPISITVRNQIRGCTLSYCPPQHHPRDRYALERTHIVLVLTVPPDKVAHMVLPRHPTLRPHARMLHHFRFLIPLLPRDQDGLSPLHYYDSVIQLVRHASREPTEQEFALGMEAASQIQKTLVAF